MRIVAIDPGLTIGMSFGYAYPGKYVSIETWKTDDPLAVARRLREVSPDMVLIEAFPGGGPRTKEAIHTLKVLGFLEYYASLLGLPVILRQPQARKSQLLEARTRLPNASPHQIDALAHALAYTYACSLANCKEVVHDTLPC